MAASGDTSEEDYDDRPRGPEEPMHWPPEGTKPAWSPLKTSLYLGAICALVLICGGLMVYSDAHVRGAAADRMTSANNLKHIAFGIHNFADDWGQLPHNTYTPAGKPLLSWRVHILPYIEQDALYSRFDLDEPWDGPSNIRLLAEMPRIYARPQDRNRLVVQTHYRGFSSPGGRLRAPTESPHATVPPAPRTVPGPHPRSANPVQGRNE